MSAPKDRREQLRASSAYNGIDFVEIADGSQTKLVVHFLNDVVPSPALLVPAFTIGGGETVETVRVTHVGPFSDRAVPIHVDTPGDFSTYTLTIDSPTLDPYFKSATFSFKALCPTTLDCEAVVAECTESDAPPPPIDYLAKDFLSFRKALSDFSALRYPGWLERSEADFGMMFMEALSALADDLSYSQDRIANEAFFDTATERRSIVRQARLVDYEPRPATAARVTLSFQAIIPGNVTPGMAVSAQGPEAVPIDFETGTGLFDGSAGYRVSPSWNAITPYWWDDADRCLLAGSTSVWVLDPLHALSDPGSADYLVGRQVLLEAQDADDPTRAPVRQIVRVTDAVADADPIFLTNGAPTPVAHLAWDASDALERDYDLRLTTLSANLVPATQGKTGSETFAIRADDGSTEVPPSGVPLGIVRLGPAVPVDVTVPGARAGDRWIWGDGACGVVLYPLRRGPLTWLAPSHDAAGRPTPEIRVDAVLATTKEPWSYRRWLLDAGPLDAAYTVDPVAYRALAAQRDDGTVFADYDGRGDTLRFGDGSFGKIPTPASVFEVTYRVGGGAQGNVAAGAIGYVDPTSPLGLLVSSVMNPFPATGGADEETDETVRRLAPQAFRADQPRAVLASDYRAAAEQSTWVQRAGTTFRWTGSWPTVFTSVDPRKTESLTNDRMRELCDRLNRYRLAGYESYVLEPRFVSLDVRIEVCAEDDAFRGDVEAAVREAVRPGRTTDNKLGFFDPDRFTFGTPLERSALEAAIQRADGVGGVRSIRFRQRGRSQSFIPLPDVLRIRHDHILRADDDPSRPERGSIHVTVTGGK